MQTIIGEDKITTNEQLYGDVSVEDAAMINADTSLTPAQKQAALMDPETYKFHKNNPHVIRDASNYPAIFENLSSPSKYAITRSFQPELQKFEDEIKNQQRTMGPFEAMMKGYSYSRRSMIIGDLEAKRRDAIHDGDMEEVAKLDKEIADEKMELAELEAPNRRIWGASGSVISSVVREAPALIGTGLATAALTAVAPETGGATAVGAAATAGRFAASIAKIKNAYSLYRTSRAGAAIAKVAPLARNITNAAIIYNDTANVEGGSSYADLKRKHPDWDEGELYEKSVMIGRVNGAIESISAFMGTAVLGGKAVTGIARRTILKNMAIKSVEKMAISEAEKKVAKSAVSSMVENGILKSSMLKNNEFLGKLVERINNVARSRTAQAIEFGSDISMEGATEVYQNKISELIMEQEQGNSIGYETALSSGFSALSDDVSKIYDHIVNGTELTPEAAETLDTFVGVTIGSALVGGGFKAIDVASNRVIRQEATSLGNQLDSANKTIQTFDTILNQKKNSKLYGKSPETANEFYKNSIKSGEIPENVFVDIGKLNEIIDEMKNDPVSMAKINALKLGEKITSGEDIDLVSIPAEDFIQVAVDPKNDTLYQKIKSAITTNPAKESKDGVMDMIKNIASEDSMFANQVNDENSIYNMVLKNQKDAGADDSVAKFNAYYMQNLFNTMFRMRTDKQTVDDIANEIKLRIENVANIEQGMGDLNQAGYVSMRGTLEGTELDWKEHRGSGEGHEAHGAGIYVLKDQATNKARYYDAWSKKVLKIDGADYIGGEYNTVINMLEKGTSIDDVKNELSKSVSELSEIMNSMYSKAEEIAKKYPKIVPYNEGLYDYESVLELSNSGMFGKEDIKELKDKFEKLDSEMSQEERLKAAEARRLINSRARYSKEYSEIADVLDRLNSSKNISFEQTGAQYEVDVPASKYLLNENKRFSKQSKYVQERLLKLKDKLGLNATRYKYDRDNFETAWKKFGSDNQIARMLAWNGTVNIIGDINSDRKPGNIIESLEGLKQSALKNNAVANELAKQYGSVEKYIEAVDEAIKFHKENKFESLVVEENYFSTNDPTGEQIYDLLKEKLGSSTQASLALSAAGIKGIEYDGDIDGTGYVIFEGKDVPIVNRLYQFAGPRATTARLNLLSSAQTMEQNNVPMHEILRDTGWFKDPNDNQWKFEISDKDAKLNSENIEKLFSNKLKGATLKDILDHELLYKAYPYLAEIPVNYNSRLKTALGQTVGGQYIDVAKTSDLENLRRTILHEVAHLIQKEEGFARGGRPKGKRRVPYELQDSYIQRQQIQDSLWEDLKKSGVKPGKDIDTTKYSISHWAIMDAMPILQKIAKGNKSIEEKLNRFEELNKRLKKVDERDPKYKYLKIPGENEARDVEYRADMSDKERAETLPANLAGTLAPTVLFKVGDEVTEIPVSTQPESVIAGSIQFGAETIIRLSKAANATTFAHEGAHLFARQLFGAYNAGVLTERWAKNADKLAEFLGISKNEYGQYQFVGNTEAEEKFAEAMTTYLKTGKSPASYLKELFDIAFEWFAKVYNALRMSEVPLNKNVTKVFDEIFVPYEKQQQILAERRFGFIPRPETMSQEQYEAYKAEKRAAAIRGTTEEVKRAAKLQEIMSNEVYKSEWEEAYSEAYEDLGQLPVYQMIDDVIKYKINKGSLAKISPDIVLPKNYLSTKQGVDITQLLSEYTNVANTEDELAQILSETPSRESAANYIADKHMQQWLQEKYPELAEINSETAARNERVFKLAVMEYMMLSGIGMERFNQIHNDLMATSEYMVQNMPLRKIVNVQRWIEQENKLMQRYDYTKNQKDMANIKRQQAILNYYTMRSKQISAEAKRFNRKSKKYRGQQTKDILKKIDGETFDLLKTILGEFKLTTAKPNTVMPMNIRIDNWITSMANEGYTGAGEIDRYRDKLITGIDDKLTTKDFEFLREAFSFIEAVGRRQKEIVVNGVAKNVEDAAQEILNEYIKSGTNPLDKELGSAVMRETVMRTLWPQNAFLDFVAPVFKGLTRKDMQIAAWQKEAADIIKPMYKKMQNKVMIDGRVYTNENLLVMMLNSGNTHNINCIVKTLQFQLNDPSYSVDDLFSALNQAPKELREMTRRIWKIFDDNKQRFQEAQRQIDGKILKFVEPEAYEFQDGEQMPGGYYPAGKVSVIRDYDSAGTKFQNQGTYATKSFQMDRTGAHGDLDLTLGSLNAWFYKMAGVLNVAVPYNNFSKLLRNETFRKTVGEGMVKSLAQWLNLSVTPDKVNQTLSAINQVASVSILGLNPIKMFTQLSGIIPAMNEVGPFWVMQGIATTNPIRAINEASKLSEYMYARYAHPEEHLHLYTKAKDTLGSQLLSAGQDTADKLSKAAMSFIIYGDAIASSVTWKAEFAKQKAAGYTDKQASDLADSRVRMLQGDASAGSRAPIIQGNMRFFTMFASYFIGLHSLVKAHGMKGNEKGKIIGLILAAAVAAPMFEAIFKTAWKMATADDDDKKKWEKEGIENAFDLYLNESLKDIASNAGAIWLPHFGLGGDLGSAIVTGRTYAPENLQLKYMLKPIDLGANILGAIGSYSKGDDEKGAKKIKKGLKSLFEFSMLNPSIADKASEIIIGE